MIERASPVEMRKTLEIVDEFKKAGIKFIPIPILSEDDSKLLGAIMLKQMEQLDKEFDKL